MNDFHIDPGASRFFPTGNSYGWSGDPVPNVAGNATASGTLVLSILGPFDLENAMSSRDRRADPGRGTARGSWDSTPARTTRRPITGEATAGSLTVKIVDGLVATGNFQYNSQATKDKVVVHLGLEAGTTQQYGDDRVGDHLVLKVPNGEQATPIGR